MTFTSETMLFTPHRSCIFWVSALPPMKELLTQFRPCANKPNDIRLHWRYVSPLAWRASRPEGIAP